MGNIEELSTDYKPGSCNSILVEEEAKRVENAGGKVLRDRAGKIEGITRADCSKGLAVSRAIGDWHLNFPDKLKKLQKRFEEGANK